MSGHMEISVFCSFSDIHFPATNLIRKIIPNDLATCVMSKSDTTANISFFLMPQERGQADHVLKGVKDLPTLIQKLAVAK